MEHQNDNETFITKIIIKEKPVYIQVIWENNELNIFSIKIFHEDLSWIGCFSRDDFNKYRTRLKETTEVYVNEIKKSLSKESCMYKYDFVISSTKLENSATFSWKKSFEGSSAVIVHGSVLVKQNNDTKNSLIDSLLQDNQILKNNLEDCREENNKVNNELEKYGNELENLINKQSLMEDVLYSKFAQLLNTKKRRIQELEDALNTMENS